MSTIWFIQPITLKARTTEWVTPVSYTHLDVYKRQGEKSIDTSLFIDDDGTPYLYFVRFTDCNVIWVAEMNDDLTGIKQETLTECIKAEEPRCV